MSSINLVDECVYIYRYNRLFTEVPVVIALFLSSRVFWIRESNKIYVIGKISNINSRTEYLSRRWHALCHVLYVYRRTDSPSHSLTRSVHINNDKIVAPNDKMFLIHNTNMYLQHACIRRQSHTMEHRNTRTGNATARLFYTWNNMYSCHHKYTHS